MSKRSFVVAANWKMYKSPREAVDYFKAFLPKACELPPQREVIFFVPAIDLWVTEQALRGSSIGWGAQNTSYEKKGAFTGENSPAVLAEIGARFSLVGHSERRSLFHESDEICARKVHALQDLGLVPMLCVGETLAERESGRTDAVITEQLRKGLKNRLPGKAFFVAYEPVWAIGTGKVATPQMANEAHTILRGELAAIGGEGFASETPILYGGSVKPENAAEIASQSEVDGFLVGGASLEVASFLSLVQVKK